MKDLFSSQSDQYVKYRPEYPEAFFDYLNSLVAEKNCAWDCGTGNGQVASVLSKSFEHVYATDISSEQIKNASKKNNIVYSVQPAEKTNFTDASFDLIVVAQAIHWFDFDLFYEEVRRTAKKGAIVCIVGYARVEISPEIDLLVTDFYENVIGKYWAPERKYIDLNYETIPFPFTEIETPTFENQLNWSLDHFVGYLNTWSAVKESIKQNNYNPIDQLKEEIKEFWDTDESKEVCFPILLRVGSV